MGKRRFGARKRKQLEADNKIISIMVKAHSDIVERTEKMDESAIKITFRDSGPEVSI
ncbi:hypothetical protein [Pantoea stewartii]|uniref:hypothetical protein n=1 Tax=Pantoea stewartii TaxID=66269 RepID=UPI00197F1CF6|nr:hypothetical protein [Pantoea stewartii]